MPVQDDMNIFVLGADADAKCRIANLLVKSSTHFRPLTAGCNVRWKSVKEKIDGNIKIVSVAVLPDVKIQKSSIDAKKSIGQKQKWVLVHVKTATDNVGSEEKWIRENFGNNVSCFPVQFESQTFEQNKKDIRIKILTFLKTEFTSPEGRSYVDNKRRSNIGKPTKDELESEEEQDCPEEGISPLSLVLGEKERKLYRDTLHAGSAPSNLVPVIVVGNENAGKTTLIKRLLTLDDPSANVGKSVTTYCYIDNGQKKWKTMKDGTDYMQELNLQQMSHAMKEKRDQQIEEEIRLEDEASRNQVNSDNIPDIGNEEMLGSDCVDGETPTNGQSSDYKAYSSSLEKDIYLRAIVERMNQATFEHRKYFIYKEYGGSSTTVLSYEAFLPPLAVYLLVVDLSLKFEEKLSTSLRKQFKSSKCLLKEYTLKETIKFWVSSIKHYAREPDGDPDGDPAPIILVATHRDKLSDEEAERKLAMIRHELHLEDLDVVHIDARESDLHTLRDKILNNSETYCSKEVPAQWIELEHMIITKRMEMASLSYKDLTSIDMQSDVPMKSVENLKKFLEFQHELGNIIYIPELNESSDIILNPNIMTEFVHSMQTACRRARQNPCSDCMISEAFLEKIKQLVEEKLNIVCDLKVVLAHLLYFNILIQDPQNEGKHWMPSLLDLTDEPTAYEQVVEEAPIIQLKFKECHMHPTIYYQFVFTFLQHVELQCHPELFDLFSRIFIYDDTKTVYFDVRWTNSAILIWLKNLSHRTKLSQLNCPEYLRLVKNNIDVCLQKTRQNKVNYQIKIECDRHRMSFVDLQLLEEGKETMCDNGKEKHAIDRSALRVYDSSPKKHVHLHTANDHPKYRHPPTDKELARLAYNLEKEELLAFARLLEIPEPMQKSSQIEHDNMNKQEGRMQLLCQWQRDKPNLSLLDLEKLICKRKDYTHEHLHKVIHEPVEGKNYELDNELLTAHPTPACCSVISQCSRINYPFVFLELGVTWQDISEAKHEHNSNMQRIVIELIEKWRQKMPDEATLERLLNTMGKFDWHVSSIVEKISKQ